MKPKTRLLVRLTLPNGDMKGWGYDYPYYKTAEQLHAAIVFDFQELEPNTAIHLLYDTAEDQIDATDANTIADQAIAWLKGLGAYN